jgi:hypothetical protein
MTTQKELRRINRLVEIIQKEEKITKVQLVLKSQISISYYEKLKPFLEEIYPHKVRYDKDTKTWEAIKNEEIS